MVQNTIFRPRSVFVKAFFNPPSCNPPAGREPLFAVVLIDTGIYGVGATRDDALRAARKWLAEHPAGGVLPDYSPTMARGCVCMARITSRLAEAVEARGGPAAVPYNVIGGIFDLATDSGATDRFEEGIERLRSQVEDENMRIFSRNEQMRRVAKEGGVSGNSTVIPNG